MDNQTQILEAINRKLIHGDQKTICENTGKVQPYVSRVLNPSTKDYDETIIEEALRIISLREQKQKKILKQLVS